MKQSVSLEKRRRTAPNKNNTPPIFLKPVFFRIFLLTGNGRTVLYSLTDLDLQFGVLPAKETDMLLTRRFLPFLLCFAVAAIAAQPELSIDRAGNEPARRDGTNTVAFTTVIEGVVSNPGLSVYVLVKSPDAVNERVFAAAVDGSKPDSERGYRWRAVCLFGEIMGTAGGSYEARAAAINPAVIQRGELLETLKTSKVKSDVITLTRGK